MCSLLLVGTLLRIDRRSWLLHALGQLRRRLRMLSSHRTRHCARCSAWRGAIAEAWLRSSRDRARRGTVAKAGLASARRLSTLSIVAYRLHALHKIEPGSWGCLIGQRLTRQGRSLRQRSGTHARTFGKPRFGPRASPFAQSARRVFSGSLLQRGRRTRTGTFHQRRAWVWTGVLRA